MLQLLVTSSCCRCISWRRRLSPLILLLLIVLEIVIETEQIKRQIEINLPQIRPYQPQIAPINDHNPRNKSTSNIKSPADLEYEFSISIGFCFTLN